MEGIDNDKDTKTKQDMTWVANGINMRNISLIQVMLMCGSYSRKKAIDSSKVSWNIFCTHTGLLGEI
jgi:hypothetical protein